MAILDMFSDIFNVSSLSNVAPKSSNLTNHTTVLNNILSSSSRSNTSLDNINDSSINNAISLTSSSSSSSSFSKTSSSLLSPSKHHLVTTSFLQFSKPFIKARASSTWDGGKDPELTAQRALDPGGGYWVSDGRHGEKEVVSFEASLKRRHRGTGIRINWAYAPRLVRVRTSGDGMHFQDSICWKSQKEGTGETFLEFDRPKKVQAIKIDMKGPYPYRFFGINQVSLFSG